jgi:hypothetical protein
MIGTPSELKQEQQWDRFRSICQLLNDFFHNDTVIEIELKDCLRSKVAAFLNDLMIASRDDGDPVEMQLRQRLIPRWLSSRESRYTNDFDEDPLPSDFRWIKQVQ